MSSSDNLELERLGGRVNVAEGQLATVADVNRIGSTALMSLVNLLALLFYDEHNERPLSGFPRMANGTDHCLVTSTGPLSFSVAPGFGMAFDPTAAGSDEWGPTSYRPIVLDDAFVGELDAHDSQARIDVVSIAPAWELDQEAVIHVKDPDDGAFGTPTSPKRARFSSQVTVTKGAPGASPSAPATPTGHIKLAEALVPALTGNATWTDCRPVLQVGTLLGGWPNRYFHVNFVPTGPDASSDELGVGPTTPESMAVLVKPGRAVIQGVCRHYQGGQIAIEEAHSTLDRIDVVYAGRGGALGVLKGTPAAVPVPPTQGNSTRLAEVYVAAGVSNIGAGDITDRRRRTPINGTLIEDASISQAKFSLTTETRWVHVPGAAFVNTGASGVTTGIQDPEDGTHSVGLGGKFFCPLRLPHGAVVEEMSVDLDCAVSASGLVAKLIRWPFGSAGSSTMGQVTASTDTGRVVLTDSTINTPTVDNENWRYGLVVDAVSVGALANVKLCGVRLKLSTTEIFS